MRKYITFILSIIFTELVGFAGTFFTIPGIQGWYTQIAKPSFNPPSAVFGPVWTLLFLLIGISLALVLTTPKTKQRTAALAAFGIQLALNLCWSFFFFYLHNPGLALIEIFVLLISIAANIYLAGKVSKPAAWLLAPYLAWVAFATILNFAIWKLNS